VAVVAERFAVAAVADLVVEACRGFAELAAALRAPARVSS
jgi:hypothetical protein